MNLGIKLELQWSEQEETQRLFGEEDALVVLQRLGYTAVELPVTPDTSQDRLQARLEAQGINIEADFRWPGGARSIYLRDPAGNCVELAEPHLWDQTS